MISISHLRQAHHQTVDGNAFFLFVSKNLPVTIPQFRARACAGRVMLAPGGWWGMAQVGTVVHIIERTSNTQCALYQCGGGRGSSGGGLITLSGTLNVLYALPLPCRCQFALKGGGSGSGFALCPSETLFVCGAGASPEFSPATMTSNFREEGDLVVVELGSTGHQGWEEGG